VKTVHKRIDIKVKIVHNSIIVNNTHCAQPISAMYGRKTAVGLGASRLFCRSVHSINAMLTGHGSAKPVVASMGHFGAMAGLGGLPTRFTNIGIPGEVGM
jgi:hypothetical protein